MVVTAQVLLDALVRGEVSSISRFSLIIFDECHHTHTNHPFNKIMGLYMDLKFGRQEQLPQVKTYVACQAQCKKVNFCACF